MGVFLPKRVAICASIFVALVIFASCASDGNQPQNRQSGVSITAALEELDSLEKPGGVDAKIFEELKAELQDKLLEIWGENARFAAKAPLGDAGRVTDLAYSPGTGELDWSYVNVGDYDVSGEVGIPDITPIALNYLALTNDGVGDDAYESWIDGDKSGEIGIADITPIAIGYMNSVFAYEILTSASESGTYSAIGTVNFPSPSPFPVTFTSTVPPGNLGWIRVRPMDATGSPGEPSNAVAVPAGNQPPVAQFNYEQQPGGFTVNFDAGESYDPDGAVVRYEWDWTSDGTYDHDGGGSQYATHDYAAQGIFECTLRVWDDGGDSGTITRTVYVVELATDWTLVEPFAPSDHYSHPACAYIGDENTGAPGIAFYNGSFDSGFVLAADGYGATWGTEYTIDTYLIKSLDLADVNGFPAIVYNDYNESRLNYARAQDAAGSVWDTAVIPDSSPDAGYPYLMLAMVGSNPAIAYYSNDTGSVYYTRSTDTTGASWGTPLVLHPFPPSGTFPSIAVFDFGPAVTFTKMSPVNPMFTRSLDLTGGSWTVPIEVDSEGDGSGWTAILALETSLQRPAIIGCAFEGNSILMYRAEDSLGAAWEPPIAIRNGTNLVLGDMSAAIVAGYPCVAYHEYNLTSLGHALVFQQALTPDGSSWSAPVYIAINTSPEKVTLLDVRGRPAVCYYVQSSPGGTHYAYSPPGG